jgi:hypothetical protein
MHVGHLNKFGDKFLEVFLEVHVVCELVGAQQVVGHQVFMRENIIY